MSAWVESAPLPLRTAGHRAPTAKNLLATATPSAPEGSRATRDQVMGRRIYYGASPMKPPLRFRALLWTVTLVAAVPCHAFKLLPTAKEPDAESRRLGVGTITGIVENPLMKVYLDQFSTPVHEDLTHRSYGCDSAHVRCKEKLAPRGVIEGVNWNDNPPFSYRRLRLTVSPTCMGVTIQLPNLHPTCWTTIFASAAGTATAAPGRAFRPHHQLLLR